MQEKRHVWINKDEDILKLKCLLVCDNDQDNVFNIDKKLNIISTKLFGKDKKCSEYYLDVDYDDLYNNMNEWLT